MHMGICLIAGDKDSAVTSIEGTSEVPNFIMVCRDDQKQIDGTSEKRAT